MDRSLRWYELAGPLVLATVLRAHRLSSQILVDDEWHMVHKLREGAWLASVVGDFGSSDHSIGLTLLGWLLGRVTTLDELMLRLPSLVAGLALVIVVPALAARRVGRATAIVLAWLLAISPLLCFFSRLARPYAMTALLAPVAVLAFERWYRAGDTRARATYVCAAALAPLFHLPALPAVLASCALPLVTRGLPRSPDAPTPRRVAWSVAATLAAIALVLAVPMWRTGAGVVARLQADHPNAATLPGLLELLAGTAHPAGLVVVAALAAVGLVSVVRRHPFFARLLLTTITAQALAVAASGAAQSHVPIVAARYLGVVLPLLWIFPAAGLAAVAERLGRPSPHLVGGAAAVALALLGPLGGIYRVPNDFTNHISYQADYRPGRYFERFRPHEIATFYRELAARPPASVTVVEAPWYFYLHPFAYTQRVHRQRVLIGFVDEGEAAVRSGEVGGADPSLHLRNAVHLGDRAALKDRGVDFVILHRDLRQEITWPGGVTDAAVDIAPWETRYRAWFGPPVFSDTRIAVFTIR